MGRQVKKIINMSCDDTCARKSYGCCDGLDSWQSIYVWLIVNNVITLKETTSDPGVLPHTTISNGFIGQRS